MQNKDRHSIRFTRGPLRLAAALLLAATALHCGPPVAPDTEPAAPAGAIAAAGPAASTEDQLALSPSGPQIAQGTAQQFTVRELRADGHVRDLTSRVRWTVTGPDGAQMPLPASPVAGLLQIGAPGRYQVTADYEGRAVKTVIDVTAAALKAVAISPTAPKIAKGLTQQFKATATFTDGSVQDVSASSAWSIKDTTGSGVAVINSLGLATSRNVGKARITAKYMGYSATANLEVTAATLRTLTLSPLAPSIAKGTSQRFTATGTFSDGTVQDVTAGADWSVMDVMGAGVASIDGTGLAVGEAVGQATVSAEYLGVTAETSLTVTPAAVLSLAVRPLAASIAKGATQQFIATAALSDGSNQDVTAMAAWSTADLAGTGVASVEMGLAKGNTVGRASVTCTYRGFSAAASLEVTPALLVSVAVNPATASVPKGRTQTFRFIGTYTDGSTQDLTALAVWTATDVTGTDVASIGASGVAQSKSVGQAQIRAAYMGRTGTAALLVTAPSMIGMTLSPSGPTIAVGATQQFKAMVLYSDGTTRDVTAESTWTAADAGSGVGVATITAGGLATGKSKGRATITAAYMGLTISTTLAVGVTPGACSVDGWCWRNPLPQGNYLAAVWGTDARNVYAVSDAGIILRWDGAGWQAETSGTSENFLGIWGAGARSIWAVGVNGVVQQWDGTAWRTQASGTTQNLSGVWGSDANNVWAVGAAGTIVKWDGSKWTAQVSGTAEYLRGVWGTSASNVWAAGASGVILHWDGTAWSAQDSHTFSYLRSVWGTSATDVWAVGASGAIQHWDGTAWTGIAGGTFETLRGVWGTGTNNVWVVGTYGTIRRWDGTAWSAQTSGTSDTLFGVWGSDTTNVWAVGGGAGVIQKWNGTAWTAQAVGTTQSLTGVWGSGSSTVWAVTSSGSILKWGTGGWTVQYTGMNALRAIWGSAANNIWAVGSYGTVLHWDGASWTQEPSGTTEQLAAVWGTSASNVFAVGSNGTTLRWNGAAWTADPSVTTTYLNGVWGASATDVWAVGSAGTLLHWDGVSWASAPSPTFQTLNAVWGSGAGSVWAVGFGGTVLKWNGTSWTAQSSGTSQSLTGIWGASASNVYAVGSGGTVLRWSGTAWSPQSSGVSQNLYGVWGSDASNVWTVGSLGATLQRAP